MIQQYNLIFQKPDYYKFYFNLYLEKHLTRNNQYEIHIQYLYYHFDHPF